MSSDTAGHGTPSVDGDGTQDSTDTGTDAEPTPGSDNDGAEAGYTPPSGSDDPASD